VERAEVDPDEELVVGVGEDGAGQIQGAEPVLGELPDGHDERAAVVEEARLDELTLEYRWGDDPR